MATDTGVAVFVGTLLSSGGNPITGAVIPITDNKGDSIPSATVAANGGFTSTGTVTAGVDQFVASYAGSPTYKAVSATVVGTIQAGATMVFRVTPQ